MRNVWIKRTEPVWMPTNLNDERMVEFDFIKRGEIGTLREYWAWHHEQGSIDAQELASVLKVIELQSGDNPVYQP